MDSKEINQLNQLKNLKKNKCIILPNDLSGVGWWRFYQAVISLQMLRADTIMEIRQNFPRTAYDYVDCKTVMCQGFNSPIHRDYFEKFLMPLRLKLGFKIIFSIDDDCYGDDVPIFNAGKTHYMKSKTQQDIGFMISNSDYMLVTNEYLKQTLCKIYHYPLEQTKVIPNTIPHWWFGINNHIDLNVYNFQQSKKQKPKILVNGSNSHYSRTEGVDDDFSLIADCVRKTVDIYQWVIIGVTPWQIKDIKNKVMIVGGCPITEYPNMLKQIAPQFIVAPLTESTFNKCKSNIKQIEAYALNIPILTSKIDTYAPYAIDERMMFTDSEDLRFKLNELTHISDDRYIDILTQQHNFMMKPYGNLNNWFMEGNLKLWMDAFNGFEQKPLGLNKESLKKEYFNNGTVVITE